MKSVINKIFILLFSLGTIAYGETLDDYFRIAAENNPGLQAKYKAYEAALQKVPQVSSLPDPTFSFGYFISNVETRVGPQRAKFSLTQMFPWFGTLSAQGEAAALAAEAKLQAFINARNKLYYRVAAAYYPLYELKRLREIERENIRILETYKSIATEKFKNGSGSMVDALRVDITLKDARTNLKILNEKQKPLLTAFNKILNRSEDAPAQIADSLSADMFQVAAMQDSLRANNPRLRELELKYQSVKAAEKAAVKQGLPKFGLGIDFVLVDERTDMNLADNGKDVIMPMISVSIPIFRGKYKAAREEARLMQQNYRLQREELGNQLISDYEALWFEIGKQKDLVQLYDKQIQTSRQTLNLLFTGYGNAGKDFEEVLRMEQQLLKYQKMKATALSQFHIAVEKMYYLTAKER